MSFATLVSATNPAFLTAFGEPYPVTLDGVVVDPVQGIFDPGGVVAGGFGSEVVTMAPSLLVTDTTAALLTRRHVLTIERKNYQPIAPPVVNASGLTTLQLQEVR